MGKLNPRVDFAFKILFGSEESTDILLSFINSVLSLEHPITKIRLLNPYNYKKHPTDKSSILDIKAQDERGRLYNIEMQLMDQVDYNQRVLYYWFKLYSEQLSEGQGFKALQKTISIHILNFNSFEEKEFHNIFRILNTKTYSSCFEDLELHFIELKKFDKDLAHVTTSLDRWVTFLNKAAEWDKGEVPVELQADPAIEKAAATLDRISLSKEEREVYEAQLKWLRVEAAAIEKAEIKGFNIGIERGIEKNREETVIRLIKNTTLSSEEIAKIAGCSIDFVQKLKS
ncbi:MAG: Rpn family recombination-promoting nuclease/putative transposase [Gammaproteobacteria bacterium]